MNLRITEVNSLYMYSRRVRHKPIIIQLIHLYPIHSFYHMDHLFLYNAIIIIQILKKSFLYCFLSQCNYHTFAHCDLTLYASPIAAAQCHTPSNTHGGSKVKPNCT